MKVIYDFERMIPMKKRISLLLTAVLSLSLLAGSMTACSDDLQQSPTLDGKTPAEAYAASLEAINTAADYEMNSVQDIKMKITANGETTNQNTHQNIIQQVKGENAYCKISSDYLDIEAWYVDGVLYSSAMDFKYKVTMSLDEYMEQMQSSGAASLMELPEKLFKDQKFVTEDGKQCLKFVIKGEEYLGLVDNALGSLGDTVDEMKIGDVSYTVYFNDKGEIDSIVTDFSASFTMQGVEASAEYHTVSTVSIGGVGEIIAPADADSYTDMTGGLGG